ncbi:MAG: hypothetical protein EOP06_19010, partial [Proteobacteria bacterium]
TLLYMKDRYLSGWNAPKIAQDLNERGVLSPLHRDMWKEKAARKQEKTGRIAKWSATEVWRAIKSPVHSGQIVLRSRELIKGQHFEQRFWDPEVTEQLERMHVTRMGNFKTTSGRKNPKTLLNGLAFCARCGTRLYITSMAPSDSSYTALKCNHLCDNKHRTCREVVARYQWVEDLVLEELGQVAAAPAMRLHLEKQLSSAVAGIYSDGTYLYASDTNSFRIMKYNRATGVFLGWVGKINSAVGLGLGAGCSTAAAKTVTPAWCTGGTSMGGFELDTAKGTAAFDSPRGLSGYGGYLFIIDSGNGRLLSMPTNN